MKTPSTQSPIFTLTQPMIETSDGQKFEKLSDARTWAIKTLFKTAGVTEFSTAADVVQANWPHITAIMTAEPGTAQPVKKPRKKRSDAGKSRKPTPSADAMEVAETIAAKAKVYPADQPVGTKIEPSSRYAGK